MQLLAKQGTIQFAAPSGTLRFERGKLALAKGVKMVALFLKCTLNINNTTGGGVNLSDGQKQTLLSLILATVNMGIRGTLEQVFVSHGFDRVQREWRRAANHEIPGYTDATNGLAKTLPNGATTAVTFFMPIPLGIAWWQRAKFKDLWGIGPSLAKLLEVELKIASSTIAANLVLSGAQTFDVFPAVVPQRGDFFGLVPKYEEKNEIDKVLVGPTGLHLALVERTNVHASEPSTSVSLKVDAMEIYNQLSAADEIVPYQQSSLLAAAGDTTDREGVYYSGTTGERPFNLLPTGTLRLTQDVKDLATFQAGFSYVPLPADSDISATVDYLAKNVRQKKLKAVCYADVAGLQVPDSMRPYLPSVLFDEDDKEFELYAGLVAGPGMDPQNAVPKSLQARAVGAAKVHAHYDEHLAAKDVAKRVAVAIPGAVQSPRGFSRQGSATLTNVKQLLGAK